MDPTINTVQAVLRRHIIEIGNLAPIDLDASLADAGLDSLGMVAFILDLERSFGIRVPPELMMPEKFASLRTATRTVSELLGRPA